MKIFRFGIVGSSLSDTLTLLEVLKRNSRVSSKSFETAKTEALEIASMIKDLIKSLCK